MPGKKLTPLALRKQLLIAESEVNRALLARDCATLSASFQHTSQHLKKVGTVVSSVAAVMAVIQTIRRPKAAPVAAKRSWWSTGFKLARWGIPLWIGFHQRKAAAAAKSNGHTQH